jgi:hypothetical protein
VPLDLTEPGAQQSGILRMTNGASRPSDVVFRGACEHHDEPTRLPERFGALRDSSRDSSVHIQAIPGVGQQVRFAAQAEPGLALVVWPSEEVTAALERAQGCAEHTADRSFPQIACGSLRIDWRRPRAYVANNGCCSTSWSRERLRRSPSLQRQTGPTQGASHSSNGASLLLPARLRDQSGHPSRPRDR